MNQVRLTSCVLLVSGLTVCSNAYSGGIALKPTADTTTYRFVLQTATGSIEKTVVCSRFVSPPFNAQPLTPVRIVSNATPLFVTVTYSRDGTSQSYQCAGVSEAVFVVRKIVPEPECSTWLDVLVTNTIPVADWQSHPIKEIRTLYWPMHTGYPNPLNPTTEQYKAVIHLAKPLYNNLRPQFLRQSPCQGSLLFYPSAESIEWRLVKSADTVYANARCYDRMYCAVFSFEFVEDIRKAWIRRSIFATEVFKGE